MKVLKVFVSVCQEWIEKGTAVSDIETATLEKNRKNVQSK